jgi:outer membrane protein assembly factor BamB
MSKRLKWFLPLSLLALVAVVGVLLLPKSVTHAANTTTGTTNWSQPGVNAQHTYYNSRETTLSTANVSQLRVKWQAQINGSTPVVVNNVLYTLSFTDGKVYAFNATSGKQLWSIYVGWNRQPYYGLHGLIVKVDAMLYVSAGQALYALNPTTGATIWTSAPSGTYGYYPNELTVANGQVFFLPGFSSTLYALNAQTGATLWTAGNDLAPILETPSYSNGNLYTVGYDFNMESGTAMALSARTGTIIWQTLIPSYIDRSFPPSIVNGTVYVITSQEMGPGLCDRTEVFALNASTGKSLWSTSKGLNGCLITATVVDNNTVYVGSFDGGNTNTGFITAFNATTGTLIWSRAITATAATPVVANGVLYVGAGALYALDTTTGKRIWTGRSQPSDSPVVVNGMVYAIVGGSSLMAFGL